MWKNNNFQYNANAQYGNRQQRAPFNNFNQPQGQQIRTRGGCSSKKYVPTAGVNKGNQMIIVNGWKKTKNGFLVIKANTTSKSTKTESGWIGHIAITVTDKNTGASSFYWGSMNADNHMVKVDKLGLVLRPKENTVFFNFDKKAANRR